MKQRLRFNKAILLAAVLALTLIFTGCEFASEQPTNTFFTPEAPTTTPTPGPTEVQTQGKPSATIVPTMNAGTTDGTGEGGNQTASLSDIPPYTGDTFVSINDNIPFFTGEEITTEAYETYSNLDALGRCGVVMACCGRELMPTGDRGSIGGVKPSGWIQAKYDFVDGKYLYNRCHLIGWQLSGEDANKKNLITGTRYFNTEGMLPFENMVADYIKETDNHVMYRVTPVFEGENLVASGVLIEAYSVEDNGEGICFNVFCYNVQPGVVINYATGASRLESASSATPTPTVKPTATPKPTEKPTEAPVEDVGETYILNTNSKKIHYPGCHSAAKIKDENRREYTGKLEDLLEDGYTTCGNCF